MRFACLFFLILFSFASLRAKEISSENLQGFSAYFKEKLAENSYEGFFVYISPKQRRIFACDDFNKTVNLGDSSSIITNYLAFKLENKGAFNRSLALEDYAKVFKFKGKNISFADLISSRAGISSNLDSIYPKDATSEEFFDFIWQMNPSLFKDSEYEFSKLSQLGAIYALSYAKSKKPNDLFEIFESILKEELGGDLASLTLSKQENDLALNYSLSLKDFCEYLYSEAMFFSARDMKENKRGQVKNAWLFSEIGNTPFAMVASQGDSTCLIANFYYRNVAIAIFIDDKNDVKARDFCASILQDFTELLSR